MPASARSIRIRRCNLTLSLPRDAPRSSKTGFLVFAPIDPALEKRGVGFRSLTEAIDTTTPGGRLVFHLFGALGQFERDLIQERTRAGLAAAAARGRKGGRKPVVSTDKLARARSMIAKGLTVREAATRLKIGKTALYEALRLAAGKSAPPAASYG